MSDNPPQQMPLLPRKDRTAAMDYEVKLLEQGKTIIIGMDEAGYGAWAGPVVAGAVCLPMAQADLKTVLRGVKDSKQMTRRQREDAYERIQGCALGYGIGQAAPNEIAEKGLSAALSLAYSRAYQKCADMLDNSAQVVLIDGKSAWKSFPYEKTVEMERIVKGDTLSLSIAAASVLAKVWRDNLMYEMAEEFPQYGFERHVGYGTAAHRNALKQYGVLRGIHRSNYKPIIALSGD
jgi:ribonuclease HII